VCVRRRGDDCDVRRVEGECDRSVLHHSHGDDDGGRRCQRGDGVAEAEQAESGHVTRRVLGGIHPRRGRTGGIGRCRGDLLLHPGPHGDLFGHLLNDAGVHAFHQRLCQLRRILGGLPSSSEMT